VEGNWGAGHHSYQHYGFSAALTASAIVATGRALSFPVDLNTDQTV